MFADLSHLEITLTAVIIALILTVLIMMRKKKQPEATSPPETATTNSLEKAPRPKNYGIHLVIGSVTVAVAVAFCFYWYYPSITLFRTETRVYQVRPWVLWSIAGATYIVFSFRFLNPITADEIGVRTFFGKPVDQVEPGPPFLPLGLFEITRLPNLTVQGEWPTEPENIFRGGSNESPPPGQKPPIRITFRESVTEAEARQLLDTYYEVDGYDYEHGKGVVVTFNTAAPDDGLAKRVTAEVVAVTKYRIINGVSYVQTIGSPEQAAKQIEDVVVSILQRFLPLMSVGQALQNIEWISLILNNAVALRTSGWGIVLETPKGAYVKSIGFHRDLNNAIAKPAEADFAARATTRASEGERAKLINEGEGVARAAQDLARSQITGRSEGLKQMVTDIGVTGTEALAAEVASTFGKSGNTTIIDSKTGIAGLAGAAASLFAKSNNSTPAAPPAPPTGGTT